MGETRVRAAVYARISQDRNGEQVGVDRQIAACKEHIKAQGWDLVAIYTDNSKSAMTGKRPEFERMLGDLGAIDIVVVWSSDRLYRRIRDLERLVDTLGSTRVAAVKSGEVNLSTADGRSVARILGALAQRESEKTGERVAEARSQRVRAGHNGGGPRPYGFTKTRDELVESEAEMIRKGYSHINSGGSLHSLTKEWNAKGITGTRGGTITPSQVREILLRPMNAGLIVHKGEIVGSVDLRIVDQDTWKDAKKRLTSHKPWAKTESSLLSGIARCYKCNGPMRGGTRATSKGNVPIYKCAEKHCVSRRRDEMDAFVTRQVLRRISDDLDALLAEAQEEAERGSDASVMVGLTKELATIQGLKGTLSDAALAAAEASVRERMASAAAVPNHRLSATIQQMRDGDPVEVWNQFPVHGQREVLKEIVRWITIAPRGNVIWIEWTRKQKRAA